MCMQVFNILYALADVSGVKDGDYFSLAKIDAASLFNDDLEILEAAANTNMDHCTFVDEKAVRYSLGPLEDLSDLIKYKEYDDGYKARQRSNDVCNVPSGKGSKRECFCECFKMDKLAIHGLYSALSMLDQENFSFNRGGDMITWYLNNIVATPVKDTLATPRVSPAIANELNKFDREVLKDLSGNDANIGLTEFISLMSLPPLVWREKYEFPRFYTFDDASKTQLNKLFNYGLNETFRGNIKLKIPNFEDFSLPAMCRERRAEYAEYCDLEDNIPDLNTIMHLMHLSEYPLDWNEKLRGLFQNFKRSNNSLPQVSYIPTCFYSDEAESFWTTRDFSYLDVVASYMNKDEYQDSLKLKEAHDFYKYNKCKKFSPKPTDHAICHTFNGLEVSKILKSSSWLGDFKEAFTGGVDPEVPLKSAGIDKESGLLFSLDTMQSYFITKKERFLENLPVNSFMIKLHQPGELPWVTSDRSSWHKISSTQTNMVTHFITIKGEKVIHTVSNLSYLR